MKLKDILGEEVVKKINETQRSDTPMPFVSDLKPGMNVTLDLKVISKRLQQTRDGKKFLLMTLSDRTGTIRGIDWHSAEENDAKIDIGSLVRVRGRIVVYEERLQLNLDSQNGLDLLKDGMYDSSRFLATTKRSIPSMYESLVKYLNSIKNEPLKQLLKCVFEEDREFVEHFVTSPAAVTVHHAYKGGLLEHTLDVVEICDFLSNKYAESLDRDLLIAGAMLHDIGKVREYSLNQAGIDKTDEGELIGHITIGSEMITHYAGRIRDFPEDLLIELKHLILSHHGEMEWGSPVVPKTTEAIVLHMADNLDSKIAQFREIENRESNASGYGWSNYDRFLNRRIFMKNRDSSAQ
ncbi:MULTISPECIES: 3'-5' exoribonuclease YhaM family protein [unclassified Kosmotoga]|uniref:3'-5' exoribonuclease YhaM family protein n=1 Tax=unclassified Kosmotoga TaxID=2631489 RepID=UPI0007C58F88|nr:MULTISPECIES: HD domain-containing protein [unclassified Kosmotoga]MDI3523782.1 3-5 exoribonuclease [Kosmotoga sp.]MDK2953326.1 3-5 exoribonuclease [Kosmotoga sp.]OAA19969.1 phosphohydrolase [Kosmotoga sp. DU53]